MDCIIAVWYRRLTVINLFLGGSVFALIVWGFIYGTCRITIQGGSLVNQRIIMDALKEHFKSTGQIPKKLDELFLLESDEIDKRNIYISVTSERKWHDIRYYPQAWDKPDRIILESSIVDSKVVTFGNGSTAVLSRWHYNFNGKELDETIIKKEGYRLQSQSVSLLIIQVFYVLLIVIFISTIITQRIMKRKLLQVT